MDEFYLEKPSINKKEEVLDYLYEMKKYNSRINGLGKLDEYINDYEDNYDQWINYLHDNEVNGFPLREEYLFIRKSDNKIIGMINLRINSDLDDYPYGHIGYSIRPEERNKGYGKKELYLALKKLCDHGINKSIIAIKDDNDISKRLMKYFNAKFIKKEKIDNDLECYYEIDVNNVVDKVSL